MVHKDLFESRCTWFVGGDERYNVLDVFSLYFKALFLGVNSTSACVLLTTFCGRPPSSRRSLKSRLFGSNPSLTEFVRNKHGVAPLIKPFFSR